jgi:transcriptional regulator with XRE-family HTH domain
MGFAENLIKMRKQRGWTQVDLSIKTGINPKTLSSYENERTEPNLGEVVKLCKVFDCSIAYLTDTKEREPGDISIEDILFKINILELSELRMLQKRINDTIFNKEQLISVMKQKESLERQLEECKTLINTLQGDK